MKTFIVVLLIVVLGHSLWARGILKTEEKKIVNEQGDEIILRGIGLGGWMLQEGYMMQTASFAGAQHEIRTKIEELIGPENTQTFYNAWLANHTQKSDIDSLAAWGFNSVRLPMHYNLFTLSVEEEPNPLENTWLNKGFELTDSLLSWCAKNKIYLILDLHAAPGGQGKDAAISDYDSTKPSLWESPLNRMKTVALWRKLAERYAGDPWIGGYDLLNEPNWELPNNNLLKDLYKQITQAVREVDSTHIIFIEGNWFANDFTGLTPPWDDNMVYSFHKYWNYNTQSEIQWMLNIRDTYNIPVWCGESGENSNVWFNDAVRLLEKNKIGWAWWPLKKVESISGPLSIPKNEGYQVLLDYWDGKGDKPTEAFSLNALLQLAENTKLENCTYQKDVIDALMRQANSPETKPYKRNNIPGKIFAADFDMGRNTYAYSDNDIANYNGSTGIYTAWNSGWRYRNDAVDIESCSDTDTSNGFNVGWTEDSEWLKYSFYVEHADSFKLYLRVASNNNSGLVKIKAEEGPELVTSVPNTNGWQEWKTIGIGQLHFTEGSHQIIIEMVTGGFNINYIEFKEQNINGIIDREQIQTFELFQNYPNPFNPITTIQYQLYRSGPVKLKVFNSLGALVWDILKEEQAAGNHLELFSGKGLASGVYYYQLQFEGLVKQKAMILLR
jgi:endoglucanase